MSKKRNQNRYSGTARPAIEWIAGALSCAMVLALITFLLHQALFRDARPPDLSVVIEGFEHSGTGILVRIAVTNSGDEAASAVRVHAAPSGETESGMRKEVEFDYVAGRSVRRGAFVFPDAAIRGNLDVEIDGFVEP